jgi:hypothetical protein
MGVTRGFRGFRNRAVLIIESGPPWVGLAVYGVIATVVGVAMYWFL